MLTFLMSGSWQSRVTISTVCGSLGALYLFGWRYALIAALLILFCGVTDIIRWSALKAAMWLFVVAVILFAMPANVEDRLYNTVERNIGWLELASAR